jgi:hypothetical protein
VKCLRCDATDGVEKHSVTALDVQMSGILNQPPMTIQQGFQIPLCQDCLQMYIEACLRNGPMNARTMLKFLGFETSDAKPSNVVMMPGVK